MRKRSFTLLEAILSISLLLILTTIIVSSYAYFSKNSQLLGESEYLEALLREAQVRSSRGVEDKVWGIHLESDKYVLFLGETYNPSDPKNQIHFLPSGLSLNWVISPSTNSIIFEKLNGVPRASGDVTIENSLGQTKTISINEAGKIERQ